MKTFHVVLLVLALGVIVSAAVELAEDPPTSSRIGFASDRWGPSQWLMLHLHALNMPRDFGTAVRDFERYLHALQKVLPCKECRDEFGLILQAVPPRHFLKHGRIGAVAYMYLVHCAVSDRTNSVHCTVKFLEEEPKLLNKYVKAFGCNIQETMDELHHDAEERGIHHLLKDGKRKLRLALSDDASIEDRWP